MKEQKIDWRKLIAVGIAGAVMPTVGTWANGCVSGATCDPFTVGNVVAPHVATLLTTATTVIAFLLTPKK